MPGMPGSFGGAPHERQAIRAAMVALLKGNTDADQRVFQSRQSPVRDHELPAICLYTDSEVTEPASFKTAPRELERVLTVAIDAYIAAPNNDADQLDDALDAMAVQIETALDADPDFDGSVFWSGLAATEFAVALEGKRPIGVLHLEYTCVYHSDLRTAAADDARDIFNTADVKIAVTPTADPSENLITPIHE